MICAAVEMAAKARRMSPLLAATCSWHRQSHYPLHQLRSRSSLLLAYCTPALSRRILSCGKYCSFEQASSVKSAQWKQI